MSHKLPLLLAGVLALWPVAAEAGCGLESCPVVEPAALDGEASLRLPLGTELRSVKAAGGSAWVSTTKVGAELWGRDRIVVSGVVPWHTVTTSDDAGGSATGLGNPLANVQLASSPASWLAVAGGVMLEVPIGREDVAESHWVVLNHVQAMASAGPASVLLRAGYLRAFGGSHGEIHGHHHGDHAHSAPSLSALVEPHGDQELRTQVELGMDVGRWRPAVVVDSAAELQASAPELGALMSDAIHALGLNLGAQLGERTSGTLMAQVPLTEARRFEWRAGLGVSLHR